MERRHRGVPQLLAPALAQGEKRKAFQENLWPSLREEAIVPPAWASFRPQLGTREGKWECLLRGRGQVKGSRMSWTEKERGIRIPALSVVGMKTCSVHWEERPGGGVKSPRRSPAPPG